MKRIYVAMTVFCAAATAAVAPEPCPPKDKPPAMCDKPQTPQDITDGAKAALACEWLNTKTVRPTLHAMRLYVTHKASDNGPLLEPGEAAKRALTELEKGDPNPTNNDLYSAAQGDPDAQGQPDEQGVASFLDMLAKANTWKTDSMSPKLEKELFTCAANVIDSIFKNQGGKQALVRVNDAFVGKENQAALFNLLEAVPFDVKNDSQYPTFLETLRAAYEAGMDTNNLAKLVAAKISKKQP